MKKIVILPSFERSIRRFTSTEKDRLVVALEKFNDFLVTGRISSGLGFKKIRHDMFEFSIEVIVAGFTAPIWLSIFGFIFALALSLWMFKTAMKP